MLLSILSQHYVNHSNSLQDRQGQNRWCSIPTQNQKKRWSLPPCTSEAQLYQHWEARSDAGRWRDGPDRLATLCSRKHIKSRRTPQQYNLHWTPALLSTWLGASTGSAESSSQKAAEPPWPLASSTSITPILYLIFQINKIQNRWSLTHTGNSTEPNWKILQHTWRYSQDCGIKFADKLDASLTVDGCTTAQI